MVQSLDENSTKEVNNNFLLYRIYGNFNIITFISSLLYI